ncbi:response regulator transcription factor [Cohnella soli]|uniref:Response regulator n=1 Tax=Cohnella soli TaxID=425005 RepID=A0ABW0HRY6_9BACL
MKLLIADDDRQIREGIKDGIDWFAIGIDEVMTASNGLEALDMFTESLPEIVLTDVKMPGIDGLELLKRVKEIRPATKVVILSGYNDFEYLKKAVQLDAVDYEMKPVRAINLIQLIKKIKEDIIREKVSEETFNKYRESYKDLFLDQLFSGQINDRLIILEGLMKYYRFDAKGPLVCVCFEWDRAAGDSVEGHSAAMDKLQDFLDNPAEEAKSIAFRTKVGELIVLFKLETSSYLYYRHFIQEMRNRFTTWIREMAAMHGVHASAGISAIGSASDFASLLAQAHEALALKLYTGRGSVHGYEESPKLEHSPIAGLLENEEFNSHIPFARNDRLSEMIGIDFEQITAERKYSRRSLLVYCKSLIQLLAISSSEPSVELSEFLWNQSERLEESSSFHAVGDYRDFVLSVYREACDTYLRPKNANLSAIIVRAEDYIRKHYTQEISVEMVAEYVGKTPNYFSHLFKKEMGVSFREYVNRLRITKAKERIYHSTDRIYEISEQVGFSDYAYFTQVFRKLEGCSPTALRKSKIN